MPNPVSQERLVGAVLTVLAIADVSQIMTLQVQRAHEPSLGLMDRFPSMSPAECTRDPFIHSAWDQHRHLVRWTAPRGPVGLWLLECNDPR